MFKTTRLISRRLRLAARWTGVAVLGVALLAACVPDPPPPPEPVSPPAPIAAAPSPPPPSTTSTTTTTTTTPPPPPSPCASLGAETPTANVPSGAPVEYVAVTETPDGDREVHTFEANSPADREMKTNELEAAPGDVVAVEPDALV
jgi:hypothetical protein